MPTTVSLQNTANWVAAFIQQRPQVGVGGIANEPFLTSANKVGQTILAPPFKWSWNRVENASIVTTPGITDYTVQLSYWGYLEKATNSFQGQVYEIQVSQVLAMDNTTTSQARPQQIAPILDDNAGNITFRLMPAPDQNYNITLTMQKAWQQASNLSALWSPIPDRYGFLYNQGMLAHMCGMYSSQLYIANMEIFFRQLVGAAEGLTETEKAIFLEDQLRILRTGQNSGIGVQQGKQARF